MLDGFFKLSDHGTDLRTEVTAGVTTFLTMAYIIFVNPSVLAVTGMDHGAVFVATCVSAALGTLIMGLYANYPVALAPGMGLNAYFSYGVVQGLGHPWEVALGAVFLSGVLFVILSVLPVRQAIVNAIPQSLKFAISAGIGLFLGIVALRNAGIVVPHPATMVALGDLTRPEAILACGGFALTVALASLRLTGAIILALLATAATGILTGVSPFEGIVSAPPSLAPTFLAMDVGAALQIGLVTIVFTFLFVDLFDTAGTLVGVAHRAGLLDERGRLPRLGKALLADSTASVMGAALGTSTVTSYIESAAGTSVGGRTGLTAVTVGVLFLLCIFFAPLAGSVPAYATAPALLFVACLMSRGLSELDWEDPTEYAPGVVTAIGMPLTFSIATGIGMGFITYTAIKILSGRARELGFIVPILALLFAAKFAFFPMG
ncbi:NCS2 family permease (plasmid) [Skermanella rosea]|uniref:NCS2 family permease n=1 Tax=Skermanella rosea TaxID=1817965 RepID=UPI001932D78D|nr:NCS2 family permease [Skermanella rosea]UEM07792.1 NCS2 family permease [Skermanella rosea]